MPKISVTKVKNKKTIKRGQRIVEYNYLKYWRVVSYWARRKYDITSTELDMLLYLYDLPYFKREDFNYYGKTMSWDKHRFIAMKRKNLVRLWRKGGDGGSLANLYELTAKGKSICYTVYQKLSGEKTISESREYNPIAKKETFSDKMYLDVIKKMNSRVSDDNE